MAALSPADPEETFTPPYVPAPARPLPLPQFFATFVRNPIRALPAAVYRDWIVTYRTPRSTIAWITGPTLIKTVLLDERETFPKTPLERKVLGPLLGDGLLTADGPAWRWQRQIVAPLFRHADLLGYVPAMAAAAEATIETWRRAGAGPRRIDRDMTRATYRVITDTILAGSSEAVAERIERAHDDYLQPITWQVAFAVLGLPGWLPHPDLDKDGRVLALARSTALVCTSGFAIMNPFVRRISDRSAFHHGHAM